MNTQEHNVGHKNLLWLFHKSSDLFAVIIAWLFLAYFSPFEISIDQKKMQLLLLAGVLISIITFEIFNVYRHWRGESYFKEIFTVLISWICTVFVLGILALYFAHPVFQEVILYWAIITAVIISFMRAFVRYFLRFIRAKGRNLRHVVIIGDNAAARRAYSVIKSAPWNGYSLIGYFSSEDTLGDSYLGSLDDVHSWFELNGKRVDQIWLTELPSNTKTSEALTALQVYTAGDVRYIPDIAGFNLINLSISSIEGMPVINVTTTPIKHMNRLAKMIEDKVISFLIIIIIMPILLLLAIGVKLSSPGPVFYRQERVGLNGKPFNMLKFRSMEIDSEIDGVNWGGATAMSVTSFGKFIRATSLDELPQFINVLKGDMSIVGPRPERTVFVDQFKHEIPGYMQKHMVKAGITGLAQIRGWRGDTDLSKRIEADIEYIRNWSVYLDLKIIIITIFKGFVHKANE